jgi:hypothetical protein
VPFGDDHARAADISGLWSLYSLSGWVIRLPRFALLRIRRHAVTGRLGPRSGCRCASGRSACGWCKDRWGISWQITPRVLTEALAAGGDEAKRAFAAMMTMRKIDVAAIEVARRG